MIVVDKRDMESLSESDLRKLLRWTALEVLRRFDDPYAIEDEISEALLIHYGDSYAHYVDIYRK